jgi:hypothetical protein
VRVCVIYESQEGNDRLFRSSEALGMVPCGPSGAPLVGGRPSRPLFVSANHAIYIWASESSLADLMLMGNRQLIRGVGASRRIATGLIVATFAVLLIAWDYDSEPTPSAEVVAAGDIASCRTQGDEATAELVEGIEGTVLALGDEAYPKGSAANFEECYGPSWGRFKGAPSPSPATTSICTIHASALGRNMAPLPEGWKSCGRRYTRRTPTWSSLATSTTTSVSPLRTRRGRQTPSGASASS